MYYSFAIFTVLTTFTLLLLDTTSEAFTVRPAKVTQNPQKQRLPLYQSTVPRDFIEDQEYDNDDNDLDFTDATAASDEEAWKLRLLEASNIASLLCIVDCTVLPAVTIALPFFGLVGQTPEQTEFLHQLGHRVALGFVLPVGGSAVTLNYLFAHQQKSIAALGALGLVLVLSANSPHEWLHGMEGSILYPLLSAVHQGTTHRVVNLMGCACLRGSNYLSRRSGKCLHDHPQNHSHDHDHHHGTSCCNHHDHTH